MGAQGRICSVDLGTAHVGVAVLDDDVRYSNVLELNHTLCPELCGWFRRRLTRIIDAWQCHTLAVEWTCCSDPNGSSRPQVMYEGMLTLRGVVLSLASRELTVREIDAIAWQRWLMGERPAWDGDYKACIRQAVTTYLQQRGSVWEGGNNRGGHRYDAIGIGLYVRDALL